MNQSSSNSIALLTKQLMHCRCEERRNDRLNKKGVMTGCTDTETAPNKTEQVA